MPDSEGLTIVDKVITVLLLIFSTGFLAMGAVAMVFFYRERTSFEIRARSAYLVLLAGISFLAVIIRTIITQVAVLLDYSDDIYPANAIKYFAIVCSTSCYGSRTIRLALSYSPEARKFAPWLQPERNHVITCVILGLVSLVVPLYNMITMDGAEEIQRVSEYELWILSIVCKAIVIALNPLVWVVDDIFNLGRELRVMAFVLLLNTVGVKLADDHGSVELTRWINTENFDFLLATIMFSLSVVLPIRQRLLRPMDKVVQAPPVLKETEERECRGGGVDRAASLSTLKSTLRRLRRFRLGMGGSSCSPPTTITSADRGNIGDGDSTIDGSELGGSSHPDTWNYERVMAFPAVAAAFETFSRKALCQENVFFLKDVAEYNKLYFVEERETATTASAATGAKAVENEEKDDHGGRYRRGMMLGGGGGGGGDGLKTIAQKNEEAFAFLSAIVREYIMDGSLNEVNVSAEDKKGILDVYKLGKLGFVDLDTGDKKGVFAAAYSEIRDMLEKNLMNKFVTTDLFRKALDDTQMNQSRVSNVTAIVSS